MNIQTARRLGVSLAVLSLGCTTPEAESPGVPISPAVVVETVTVDGRAVEAAAGEIIVTFEEQAAPAARQDAVRMVDGRVLQYSRFTGNVLIGG